MPRATFRAVFLAVFFGTLLLVAAFLLNARRPAGERLQPSAQFVSATGKCAECHRQVSPAVVHEFEISAHAVSGKVSCLDCHTPQPGQEKLDHNGFTIARHLTSQNCGTCHRSEVEQYLRSRHAAPAWAAVSGSKDFTPQQIEFAEKYHPGWVKREANPLVAIEGQAAVNKGCYQCHDVGKPNSDGSIGNCTACHARHAASLELARSPRTCGQCHMGPDHSQIEIYEESKHGVLFASQREHMNLSAKPDKITTADMPVPTCATCHMGALNGIGGTHDTTERLSYYLFAPVSERRPNYQLGQARMQDVCLKCHTRPRIDEFYKNAEAVIETTNQRVRESQAVMKELYDQKLLSPAPFDQPIKFAAFDLWHYYGRTAKHGAFMGGADFVQWHGYYEMVNHMVEVKHLAQDLREKHGEHAATTQPGA
ncbi:MAG TPA: multiheme c-type cytochrome [Tepidisphaeraceae bacterium]|nr:multiheme c-type cytochrome [Tepidisphaeraceae bacterium]